MLLITFYYCYYYDQIYYKINRFINSSPVFITVAFNSTTNNNNSLKVLIKIQ